MAPSNLKRSAPLVSRADFCRSYHHPPPPPPEEESAPARTSTAEAPLYLLQLALVILVGDHQSQSQVALHPPGSLTEERMFCFTHSGLHPCTHSVEIQSRNRSRLWRAEKTHPEQPRQPRSPAPRLQEVLCCGFYLVDVNLSVKQLWKMAEESQRKDARDATLTNSICIQSSTN